MELQGRSRLVKWHLEIMNVVIRLLGSTLICKHTPHQEEACKYEREPLRAMPPYQVGLKFRHSTPIGCSLVHLFIFSLSSWYI